MSHGNQCDARDVESRRVWPDGVPDRSAPAAGVDCGASDPPTATQRVDPTDRARRVPPTLVQPGRKRMFRLMTSILTAAFVTSLIAGVVPGKDPDEPVPAKAKAAGSVSREAYPAKKKAAGPASRQAYVRSDRALSPSEAASRVGQRVTVEFTVRATGLNAAGFLELYSGRTWQEEGSFFIRFPGETQQRFERLGIADLQIGRA